MRLKGNALVFLVVLLAGLAVWAVSTPAVAGRLLGGAAYRAAYSFPLLSFFGLPLLLLPPLVASFALPRGSLVWGMAAVLPYAPGTVWLLTRAGPEVTFGTADPGAGQILGLVFVNLLLLIALTVACAISAAAGAGTRMLLWRLRGESVAEKLGLQPASRPSG